MKIKRVFAISKKEYLQIIRDPISLSLSFLMPAVLLFLFGYAISFDIKNIKICALDQERSSKSRNFISKFESSGYFKVISYLEREDEIDKFLVSGRASLGIWVPQNFSKNSEVLIVIDGSDAGNASIILNYISDLLLKNKENSSNINLKIRFWYNEDLKSKNFIIPGLIALIIAIISALLSSLTISREWERGTMEKLISTPLKPSEVIIGKLIPYFTIGIIDLVFSVLIALILFKVPLKGNLFFLSLVSSIYLFGGLSYGILISTATKSQILSIQISIVSTYLPTLLLSGFIFAIENMPDVIQTITYLVPARYFIFIVRNIFLKGSPVNYLYFQFILLILFSLLFFTLSIKKFKKEV